MRILFCFIAMVLGASAQAPFPQPFSTFYGNAYSEEGVRINDEEIEMVLFAGDEEVGSSIVVHHPSRNENFRIEVPTVAGAPDTRLYSVMLREDGAFRPVSLVSMQSFSFSPEPGGLSRFDLVDGEGGIVIDSPVDLDFKVVQELPDGWIEVQFNTRLGWDFCLEAAEDIENWSTVSMAVNDDRENLLTSLPASSSKRVTVTVPPRGFYRLVACR